MNPFAQTLKHGVEFMISVVAIIVWLPILVIVGLIAAIMEGEGIND